MRERIILLLAWLLTMNLHMGATITDRETMVSLSITDGLAGETVNRVMIDHSGLVWIATNNGVNVYNGKQLTTFDLKDKDHTTVTVKDLCETSNHDIYAATDAGLFVMHMGSNKFKRILPEVDKPECLLAVGDTLYIGGRQGIQLFAGGKLKQKNVGVSGKGLDNVVRQYVKGSDGLIYFLSRYDLNSYDPKTDHIQRLGVKFSLPDRCAPQQFCLTDSCIFIGTKQEGLFMYDRRTKQTTRIKEVGYVVTSVGKSADGYITVSTDGSGAFLINPSDGSIVERYNTNSKETLRLPTNAVYCFLRDENGINWFGFVRYGLAYMPHNSQLFKPYGWTDFTMLGTNVRTLCMHDTEGVIGTQDGFWFVDSAANKSRYFSSDEMGGGHIVNTIAWFEGKYYVGTFDGGLCVFDPKTQSISRQTIAPQLSHASIGDIKAGPDGRLWIGSSDGLFIVDSNGKVLHYTEQNSPIISGIILSITFDEEKNAWMTGASGISLYSAVSGEIVEANWPEDFFHRVPYMLGAVGHDSLIYMRTGPQVFFTNPSMTRYGELPLPISLSDKWCRSMVDDRNRHLWLASERGLFCFNYEMDEMMQLGSGEGLLGSLISEITIDKDNLLWVATSRGLFTADPKTLEQWKHKTNYTVRLYNIRRGSDFLSIGKEMRVNEEKKIHLGWDIRSEVLHAEAILTDYASQRGRLYEYRIGKGKWKIIKDGEPVEIRHLWLGMHRLEIRLAGADGTTSVYKIVVYPTLWAIIKLLLLLTAILLFWLWNKYRKNTHVLLSERDEIENALIEVEEQQQQLEENEQTSSDQKYQKVKIDDAECAGIVKRMKQYLEKDKVYTNADLKMKDLADVLHLSPSKLSQVFNRYLNENYYEFINRYRLNEFKQLIEAGEYKRYTITALSEKCGFKKSNFFSTFRKVEGMTPAEYLKKKGIKL